MCGIGQTSSMRQGFRLLHSRINSAAAEASPTSPNKQGAEHSAIWIEQHEDHVCFHYFLSKLVDNF